MVLHFFKIIVINNTIYDCNTNYLEQEQFLRT